MLSYRISRSRSLVAALFVLFFITPSPVHGQAPPLEGLDAYIADVLSAFEVPGVAVAVVKDGEVVLAEGYGVRALGQPEEVDAQTLFGIASNSKAFTATALGMLVEEGKLGWDDPVIQHLPWFQMWDPYVTRELTVRDLLVHRSGLGLGAGDLLWWPPTTYEPDEIVRRLRYVRPETSFRSTYAYDNVLYIAAGELIEAVSGQTWDAFIQTRILDPLGMTATSPSPVAPGPGKNVAVTHAPVDGEVRAVPPYTAANANAAAGIHANAEDIAKWLIVQLDSGRVGPDRRIFSPATTRELWTLVTPMPISPPAPALAPLQTDYRGYALGFEVRAYRGYKLVTHTGGLPGFVSRVAMIPDLKLGVAVFTNQESGEAFNAITFGILDRFLGAEHDWIGAFKETRARYQASVEAAEAEIAARRDSTARPSLPLASYAGTYTDAWYGDVVISQDGDGLDIRFANTPWLVGDLVPWQHDTFVARWHDRAVRADAFVTFYLTPAGEIKEVLMEAVSPATDFSFDFHDLLLKPAR